MAKKEEEKSDISKLEEQREALKKELDDLQKQLEQTVNEVKEGVTSRADISYWIRKYPLQFLGTSFFVGLLLGIRRKSSEIQKSESSREENILWSELKKAAIRRGVQRLMDMVDQKMDEMNPK